MASTKRKASTELTNQPLQKKRCESKLQQEVEGTGPPNFKTELEETNNETASFSVQNPTTLSLNDKPEPEVDKSEAVPSAAKTEPTPTSLPARRKVKNPIGSQECRYSVLYRLLKNGEDAREEGINAALPDAEVSVHDHVRVGSSHRSQFISTSASLSAIHAFAEHKRSFPKRIATIDVDALKKLDEVYFIDLSDVVNRERHLRDETATNCARKYQEVLVLGDIPSSCVKDIEVLFSDSESDFNSDSNSNSDDDYYW